MSSARSVSIRSRGFTLIEVMVVVAIIGTLALLVGPAVFRNLSDAKQVSARTQLEILSTALELYRLDHGRYPTTAEGLTALREAPGSGEAAWRGPYVRRAVPLDPWGRPYHYESPGVRNPESFDLYTLGLDGLLGGSGENADVTSWGADPAP